MTAAAGGAGPDRRVRLSSLVRTVPDFPTPGVTFADLTPLFADATAFAGAVAALAEGVPAGVQAVAAVEARGFVLGAPLALALGAAFVPVRKAGKLPAATVRAEYALEYATATIEVHADAVPAGARVLLVDDVLATGGTAAAAAGLLERLGAHVVAVRFLAELPALGGRAALAGRDVSAVLSL